MSAIINVGSTPAILPYPSASTRTASVAAEPTARGDVVEFSPLGRALARATELSSLSLAKIRAIRGEIAGGTYETPERIGVTVQRLLDVLA